MPGYPKTIYDGWDGLEGNLDAGFVNASLEAGYFFKENKYWKYDFLDEKMYEGYPKTIPSRLPVGLTAVVGVGQYTYFFAPSGVFRHDLGSDELQRYADADPENEVDAAFPLIYVEGYFAVVRKHTYSIYRANNYKVVKVYQDRPIFWDYRLPMCNQDKRQSLRDDQSQMMEMCKAYVLLGKIDYDIEINQLCYSIMDPFDVYPKEKLPGAIIGPEGSGTAFVIAQ